MFFAIRHTKTFFTRNISQSEINKEIQKLSFQGNTKGLYDLFTKKNFTLKIREYNSLLTSDFQNKDSEAIQKILQEMKEKNIDFNNKTLSILLRGYSLNFDLEKALLIKQEMEEKQMKFENYDYFSLFVACEHSGKINEIKSLYKEMLERNIKPDQRIFELLIFLFHKHGRMNVSKEFFEEMEKFEIKPIPKLYTFMINGFLKKDEIFNANEFMKKAKENKIEIGSKTYRNLFVSNSKFSNVEICESLFHEMTERKIGVFINNFNIFLEMLTKNDIKKAEAYFEKYKSIKVYDRVTYSIMLTYYSSETKYNEAMKIHETMKKLKMKINSFTCNLLMKLYLGKNEMEKIKELVIEMGDMDIDMKYYSMMGFLSYYKSINDQQKVEKYLEMKNQLDKKNVKKKLEKRLKIIKRGNITRKF
jgi:pentatricopeptide repeat protein